MSKPSFVFKSPVGVYDPDGPEPVIHERYIHGACKTVMKEQKDGSFVCPKCYKGEQE